MTDLSVRSYPLGEVLDRIAVWQIIRCGAKEKRRASGSLFEQMFAFS